MTAAEDGNRPLWKRPNVWLGLAMVLFSMIMGDVNCYYLGKKEAYREILHERGIDIP
jgi:hypothetical protein